MLSRPIRRCRMRQRQPHMQRHQTGFGAGADQREDDDSFRVAGSPTAMLLARQGYRVLVVDRATFPSDTISTHLLLPPGVASFLIGAVALSMLLSPLLLVVLELLLLCPHAASASTRPGRISPRGSRRPRCSAASRI